MVFREIAKILCKRVKYSFFHSFCLSPLLFTHLFLVPFKVSFYQNFIRNCAKKIITLTYTGTMKLPQESGERKDDVNATMAESKVVRHFCNELQNLDSFLRNTYNGHITFAHLAIGMMSTGDQAVNFIHSHAILPPCFFFFLSRTIKMEYNRWNTNFAICTYMHLSGANLKELHI